MLVSDACAGRRLKMFSNAPFENGTLSSTVFLKFWSYQAYAITPVGAPTAMATTYFRKPDPPFLLKSIYFIYVYYMTVDDNTYYPTAIKIVLARLWDNTFILMIT